MSQKKNKKIKKHNKDLTVKQERYPFLSPFFSMTLYFYNFLATLLLI